MQECVQHGLEAGRQEVEAATSISDNLDSKATEQAGALIGLEVSANTHG